MVDKNLIQNFFSWDSWFSKYKTKPGGRYYTWKVAIGLFLQRGGETILETGCMRQMEDWGAGCSTYIFGEICSKYNKQLITIDNIPEHLDLAKNATKQFKQFITYELADSIQFLSTFTKPIDFLYLDSVDCPVDENADAKPAQKHALKELLAVYNNLTENAVVVIDDNDWKHGGKTALAKRYLWENDWKVVLDEKQTVWIR